MRKLCAWLLLTFSAWLLVAPFAAASTEQRLLPACCRRMGTHHCAGVAMLHATDRQQASFRAAGCLLMPHRSLAVVHKLAGALALTSVALLVCWSPFFSTAALNGYARALALKSPRGPPRLSFA